MKKIISLSAIVLLIACGTKTKNPTDPNTSDTTQQTTQPITSNYPTDSLLGEYIGGFGTSTLILSVNYINGKNASGYNIVKGNRRNIKGEVKNQGGYFEFELSEPGGNEFDGKFTFTIDTTSRILEGTWAPLDSSKVKSQKYKLTKRTSDRETLKGMVGTWYLRDLALKFKADGTGEAKGYWWDEKTETSDKVEIPFTWFENKKDITIEWSKNKVFPESIMKFKYKKADFEEFYEFSDYTMYRF